MARKPISIATARAQLVRINEALASPLLLVGGLAVQRYYVARNSHDIDLICENDVALDLIEKLYPTKDWEVVDLNDDHYRPSYRVKHRSKNLGEIVLGPKIAERPAYQFMDWSLIGDGAVRYRVGNKALENILIPNSSALAYTKILSFISRRDLNKAKGLQDLKDLANLSNHEDFSPIHFLTLANKLGSVPHIQAGLCFDQEERKIFEGSSFSELLDLFGTSGGTTGTISASEEKAAPHEMPPLEDEIVRIALRYQGEEHIPSQGRKPNAMLLVVDIQNDFFAGGALAAHNADSLVGPLSHLIRQAESAGMDIVFARDWHPEDHYSFKDWGEHCRMDSHGAEFHPALYRPEKAPIIDIGVANDMDGYSPFADPRLGAYLASSRISTVYIVGIALEFCVLAACRDALWYGKTVIAVEPYIRSATPSDAQREEIWQLLLSLGVIRAQNVAFRSS